jgi:GntR family phosphonate transport system transcriptional regulator
MTRRPIWISIHETLVSELAQGLYIVGDRLPTEAQLAARFGVNRHTIRRALSALSDSGLVHSRRGAGVFVAAGATDYPIGRRVRFHQNLEAAGRLPGKEILLLETRKCSSEEATALSISAGTQVHSYDGLSLADGHPIAVFRSSFPAERFPALLAGLEVWRSVTAALKEAGVSDYTRASTRISAIGASPVLSAQLRTSEGAPLLMAKSINVDEKGLPIEYGLTWFAGDRVTITFEA